jgi:2-methylisocitrate lyase-like PEP mutase family enzyme
VSTSDQASKAEALRLLHRPGNPVVLPNAWDASSAQTFQEAGFKAVATSSGAVAAALGYEDGEKTPADEMFAAIARIARSVDIPVTADIERGYQLDPEEIAQRLLDAGAVGCNLEDSDAATKELVAMDEQAGWLGRVRDAAAALGVPIVLNARVDVHLRKWGEPEQRLEQAVSRAERYIAAGADCVYPIFLNDPPELQAFVAGVGAPVNAVFVPGSSISSFASLGVARVTFGSGLYQATEGRLKEMAGRIAAEEDPYA